MSLKLNNTLKRQDGNNKNDIYEQDENNIYPRLLGGAKEEFPLHFPEIDHHSIKYIELFLGSYINWKHAVVDFKKILFLVNINGPAKKYIVFNKTLGFNDQTCCDLQKQISLYANRYKLFLTNKIDKYGYRVKVYMPIYSLDRKKYLIIKTLWLINKDEIPMFITAYFEPNYIEDAKNEI